MIDFVQHFSFFKGDFEFIVSKGELSKALFFFNVNQDSWKHIQNYLEIKLWKKAAIESIFSKYNQRISHIWYDSQDKRYKIYISLYNILFKDSLQIIKEIKNVLWIVSQYYLETDFYKFDCIWIDVSDSWYDLKIYELVKKEWNFWGLPSFCSEWNVKEIWYLKNFAWRKKKFFRFFPYIDMLLFSQYFEGKDIKSFQYNIKDFYILQKKVKYYCFEEDKNEVYFI